MSVDAQSQINHVLKSIRARQSAVDTEARRLRTPPILTTFDKRNHHSWCVSVVGDCLVRVRLLLEQNFHVIETIGVLAVTRYLFELSVWLHLFELDARYSLVYYAQLLETQRRYFTDYRAQLLREISMLRRFEQKEAEARSKILRSPKDSSDARVVSEQLKAADQMIDEEAARHFSLFAEHAKVNGYGYQAHLVESTVLPRIDASLAALAEEQAEFDANALPGLSDLIPKRWEWRKMAEKVGLTHEYDFLYVFASKLLHATPASITTDQKNLELEELVVFLKYIDVKIMEIIERARNYPRDAA